MKTNSSALLTVFLVVLVDLIGFGIVLPLLPFVASQYQAGAVVIGLLYSSYSFMQLLFSPLWGAWSDRVGRKPIMLISTFGSFASYILFAFCGSLPVLFFSRILAGIMGGNISAAQAAVADITSPEDRAKGMGLIGAAFGIGFMIGPALAGILTPKLIGPFLGSALAAHLEQHPLRLPGLFAAILSAASFLLVFFHLPETKGQGSPDDSLRIQKQGILSASFWKNLATSSSSHLKLLFAAGFLLAIGQSSLYGAFPLFCETKLLMNPHQIAMQFAVMGLVAVFIQGGLLRLLLRKFTERALFMAGCILMVAGLVLLPTADSTGRLILYLAVLNIGFGLNGPTLTSLLSKEAGSGRIGSVMGSSQGLSALGRVIGPTWGGWLFAISLPLPFWATAGLVSFTILIAFKMIQPKGDSL